MIALTMSWERYCSSVGIVPVRRFEVKERRDRDVAVPTSEGKVPVRDNFSIWIICIMLFVKREEGIVPPTPLLSVNKILCRVVKGEKISGRVPVMLFEMKIIWAISSLQGVPSGPKRPSHSFDGAQGLPSNPDKRGILTIMGYEGGLV
tara:strand:- start:367 stop:810 length:444 start_codon:yes stop_codon:yes gene_type:complete